MRVLFGIWHSELVLFMRDKPLNPGFITLSRDEGDQGVLRLIFQHEGGSDACLHKVDAEETMDYPWELRTHRPSDDGFARCSLMPVELRPDRGQDMKATLPHDHLFPWPLAKDCQAYVRSEELAHDLEVRRAHAKLIGAKLPTPPANIVSAMTARQRKALFSNAA